MDKKTGAAERTSEKPTSQPNSPTSLQRFERSMVMDFEKWHDRIGYDIRSNKIRFSS